MDGFLTSSGQLLILFLLVFFGWLLYRQKLLTRAGVDQLTTVLLFVVIPLMTIDALQLPYDPLLLADAAWAALTAVLAHLGGILLARWLLKDQPELQFGAVLANVGFFALPLLAVVAGPTAVFYGVVFLLVFHLFTWTYGVGRMAQSIDAPDRPTFRRALINPGSVPVLIALLLFLLDLRLPLVVGRAVADIGGLNRVFGMMVVGAEMAARPLLPLVLDRPLLKAILIKLLFMPLLVLPLALLLTRDRALILAMVIPAGTPPATNVVMFASRNGRDTLTASRVLGLATLASMLTLPLLILLVDLLLAHVF